VLDNTSDLRDLLNMDSKGPVDSEHIVAWLYGAIQMAASEYVHSLEGCGTWHDGDSAGLTAGLAMKACQTDAIWEFVSKVTSLATGFVVAMAKLAAHVQ
jgi:hypothetical protein